jgi:hypothetical protein
MSETERPLKVFLCHVSVDKLKVREHIAICAGGDIVKFKGKLAKR